MIVVLNRFVAKMGAGALADSLRQPVARLLARRDEEKDGASGGVGATGAAAMANRAANPPEPIVDLKTVFLPEFSLAMMNSEELARQVRTRLLPLPVLSLFSPSSRSFFTTCLC